MKENTSGLNNGFSQDVSLDGTHFIRQHIELDPYITEKGNFIYYPLSKDPLQKTIIEHHLEPEINDLLPDGLHHQFCMPGDLQEVRQNGETISRTLTLGHRFSDEDTVNFLRHIGGYESRAQFRDLFNLSRAYLSTEHGVMLTALDPETGSETPYFILGSDRSVCKVEDDLSPTPHDTVNDVSEYTLSLTPDNQFFETGAARIACEFEEPREYLVIFGVKINVLPNENLSDALKNALGGVLTTEDQARRLLIDPYVKLVEMEQAD